MCVLQKFQKKEGRQHLEWIGGIRKKKIQTKTLSRTSASGRKYLTIFRIVTTLLLEAREILEKSES